MIKNINQNLLEKLKKTGIVLLSFASALTMTACNEVVDCDVNEEHAHLFTNESGYVIYVQNEHSKYNGFQRQEDFITVNPNELMLRAFEAENGLMRISENIEIINKIQNQNQDFTEYRYRYIHTDKLPKTSSQKEYTFLTKVHKSWTTNATRDGLTGEERTAHYVYQGIKIITNADGNFEIVESDFVDDIFEIADEYPYIRTNYFKVVDLSTRQELDYEDGKQEDMHYDSVERKELDTMTQAEINRLLAADDAMSQTKKDDYTK